MGTFLSVVCASHCAHFIMFVRKVKSSEIFGVHATDNIGLAKKPALTGPALNPTVSTHHWHFLLKELHLQSHQHYSKPPTTPLTVSQPSWPQQHLRSLQQLPSSTHLDPSKPRQHLLQTDHLHFNSSMGEFNCVRRQRLILKTDNQLLCVVNCSCTRSDCAAWLLSS